MDEELRRLERAALEGRSAEAWSALTRALERAGKPHEAYAAAVRATALDPDEKTRALLAPPMSPRTRCRVGDHWVVNSVGWPGLQHLGPPVTIPVGSFDEEIAGSDEAGVPPEWWARTNSSITRLVDLGQGVVGANSSTDRDYLRQVDLIRGGVLGATDVVWTGFPDLATGGRFFSIALDRSGARLAALDASKGTRTELWPVPQGEYGLDHFVIDAETVGIVAWDVPMNSHAAWREHRQLATIRIVDLASGVRDAALTLHASTSLDLVATPEVVLACGDDAWDDGGIDGAAYDLALRRLWSFPAGSRLIGEDRRRVFVTGEGSIRALDLASGAEVGSVSVEGNPRTAHLVVSGEVLVFRFLERLVAVDRSSLAPLWMLPHGDDRVLATADSILVVYSGSSVGVVSLDPRTGRRRSSADLPRFAARGAVTLAAGRLVFASNEDRESPGRNVAPVFPKLVIVGDAALG